MHLPHWHHPCQRLPLANRMARMGVKLPLYVMRVVSVVRVVCGVLVMSGSLGTWGAGARGARPW